ncbi:ABC transporter substrate-binding protein [Streptomyces sp. NPDC017405]|uniref:ABC transporter substrate-binding protein n=1 Tax=unclassified Streptomyces TaxID=2593676 RepID=UPI0037A9502A
MRDSRSAPGAARQAVRDLADRDGARVVLTMAGTRALPAVADACEEAAVPCLSTTFPWQAYLRARGADPAHRFRWTYHFAWGLDDIARVFAGLWERVCARATVGCLGNDGLHGRLLRHERYGFPAALSDRGHTLADLGAYREPAGDLQDQADRLREFGAEIVTSAATAADLALFHRRVREAGLRLRLITCSRRLTYPHPHTRPAPEVHAELGAARVGTLVYWSPGHPCRSSLEGTTAAEPARAYQEDTGDPWLQTLGLAHALLETARHALATAADPADRAAVADALARTRLDTVAGRLDFTAGPTPNIALLPLVGGQWQPGPDGPRLTVVDNTAHPAVPLTGELTPTD